MAYDPRSGTPPPEFIEERDFKEYKRQTDARLKSMDAAIMALRDLHIEAYVSAGGTKEEFGAKFQALINQHFNKK